MDDASGDRLSKGFEDRRRSRLGRLLREADRNDGLVKAMRTARRIAPGGDELYAAPTGDRASDRLARLISQAGTEQPSAVRELGLAGVQVWQALSRSRGLHPTDSEVTILFTDLVEFSTWALEVGDDNVLRLLRAVGRASDPVITRHGGRVVKSLGDGLMAVFADTAAAIDAAYEACTAVSAITIDGYRPQLRAGLHSGQPRRVRDDYLGVDVNIAARVANAASSGEVLVSGPALENVDAGRYVIRRRRRFRAKGAPKDLDVYSVVPRFPSGRS
ncbi:adenylate/guanylate cyclase domain-containing protein [Amycolatopsis nigrescens]|uniref:adenylate/guanylate cyclase domain-containing protein n=1 Tax=Amycolatopsis nigrescens TaxID=381445 RepID=UPI0003766EC5|nr:adenylate/guanylate cyclase domain-containing protein [Amycolatopsis nigrescens]